MTDRVLAPEPIHFDPDLADGSFTLFDREGKAHRLPGVDGMSLMEIIRGYGFPIPATCGGAATCGTCHVFLDPAHTERLPMPREDEEWQLDHLVAAGPNSRLACQIIWNKPRLDGLKVTLAPLE